MLSRIQVGLRYEPESQLLFANMTVAPNDERRRVIDRLIRDLKVAGVWAKLDCLYLFAAHDSTSALINWKNPGTFNASLTNAPSFVADRGFTGNGSNAYVGTGYTPNTAGGVLVTNSAHVSGRCLSNAAAASGNRLLGPATAGNSLFINPRNTGDVAAFIANDNTTVSLANASSVGHFLINRSASNARQAYKDGASLGSDTTASIGLGSTELRFLQFNGTFSSLQVASGTIGSSLSAGEVAAFCAAELAYMQAVGAA